MLKVWQKAEGRRQKAGGEKATVTQIQAFKALPMTAIAKLSLITPTHLMIELHPKTLAII
jgi:hypothetical protein